MLKVSRTTKLRWRRHVRRSRRQVEGISQQAEQNLEQHLITRLSRLWDVRRFLLSWLAIVGVLAFTLAYQLDGLTQYYQHSGYIAGGTYTEGIRGTFTNANPLYSSGPVDSSIASLIFAGLFKYDTNNKLVGDLAQKISVNERGTVYTVTLKDHLRWHDGVALTADDVIFTYQTIQNPDAKSTLASSWQGVKVAKVNNKTVSFTLSSQLSSFPYSLTNGIVPRHKLDNVPAGQLRSVAFNTVKPVGSGPFKWDRIEVSGNTPETREERIAMVANDTYVGGKPKLDRFVIRAFHDDKKMTKSFVARELDAIAGLESLPDNLHTGSVQEYSMPLTSSTMVFFKTDNPVLANIEVRKALVLAANPSKVVHGLGYPARLVKEPLLANDVGYNKDFAQLTNNPEAAKQMLDKAGWLINPKTGIRAKGGQPLTFMLMSESTGEYSHVAQVLQQQWRDVGVDAQVSLQPTVDLQTTFIVPHNYDALLYGISLGVDPDVFAYWHSSQADVRSINRLNFSEYKSSTADRALEAGRTRTDEGIRAIKYKPFLEAWRNDAPALALYQPRFLYITRVPVSGLSDRTINAGTDRYANVQKWMIRQKQVNN
jgi:peptide/nickel transport system substrate-binding protein